MRKEIADDKYHAFSSVEELKEALDLLRTDFGRTDERGYGGKAYSKSLLSNLIKLSNSENGVRHLATFYDVIEAAKKLYAESNHVAKPEIQDKVTQKEQHTFDYGYGVGLSDGITWTLQCINALPQFQDGEDNV